MSYITLSDYDTLLARSVTIDPVLQEYIDRYENVYIRRILGVELGNIFISEELAPSPRIQTLIDEIAEQDENFNEIHESQGMKAILINCILYHYVSETQATNSPSGGIVSLAETASVLGFENATRYGEVRFNEALEWIYTIQWFCGVFDTATYPEYDGTYIRPKYSALL